MSSKVRSMARGIARYNIGQQDIPIFGKYTQEQGLVRKGKSKKYKLDWVKKSFFSKQWRAYC